MRIGIVLDEYRAEVGGAFSFQSEILKALPTCIEKSEHEFIVFHWPDASLPQFHGVAYATLEKPNLFDRFLLLISKLAPNLRPITPLERVARKAGVEFLWFLSPRTRTVTIPYLTIVLDLQHRVQPWFPEVSAGGEWNKRERHYQDLLPRAAAIIVGTEAGKTEVEQLYRIPKEKIHMLPHPTPDLQGIEDKKVTELLAPLGLKPGFIFYPAQFWKHKNHTNLLLAIAEIKRQGKAIEVVLTGSDFGTLASVRSKARELDISKQVHFLGFVTLNELASLYQGALALTYVSYFGPENLPPLEAFALGCPVIAANVSGAKEQLADAAILVDPSDPMAIAAAIQEISNDHALRQSLIGKGRERAQKWTSFNFVSGALDIINEVT